MMRGTEMIQGFTPGEVARGYRLHMKPLALSFVIEAAIVASGVWAGFYFANVYAGNVGEVQVATIGGWQSFAAFGASGWWMALVGALMLCFAELARIPLALAARTHGSRAIRVIAYVAVTAMILVTAKGVAQVLASAYHPRLVAVQDARSELSLAEAELAVAASKRGTASTALEPIQKRVDDANERIAELNQRVSEQGQAPKQNCWKVWHRNKRGKQWSETKCATPPWAGQQFADQLQGAFSERDAAVAALKTSASALAAEAEAFSSREKRVAELRDNHRRAVMNSQLHDLAGMLLGVDPTEISDAAMHQFLRIFIIVPALLIASASTILALTSVTRVPSRRKPVEVPREEDSTLAEFVRDVAERSINRNARPAIVQGV